jgi:hypothetical protein
MIKDERNVRSRIWVSSIKESKKHEGKTLLKLCKHTKISKCKKKPYKQVAPTCAHIRKNDK